MFEKIINWFQQILGGKTTKVDSQTLDRDGVLYLTKYAEDSHDLSNEVTRLTRYADSKTLSAMQKREVAKCIHALSKFKRMWRNTSLMAKRKISKKGGKTTYVFEVYGANRKILEAVSFSF